MPDEKKAVTLDDIAVLAGLMAEVDARTKKLFELTAAMAELQQEMLAKMWVNECISKAAWSVSFPPDVRQLVIRSFRENLKALNVADPDSDFAKRLHAAARGMLESFGEGSGEPGVH